MLPDCSFQAVEKSIWSGRSSFGEPQESLQMVLVQSNDVVEQIPSAAADPALSNTVLPRAPDGSLRGDDFHGSNRGWNFQSHTLHRDQR